MTRTRELAAARRLSGEGNGLDVLQHEPQPPVRNEASVSGIDVGALTRSKEVSPRWAVDCDTDNHGR